jgi:hypothetical protein
VCTKEEKPASPADSDPKSSAPDQLQKQIDALVRGELPKGSRSLRDLAKNPIPGQEIRQKGKNQDVDQ